MLNKSLEAENHGFEIITIAASVGGPQTLRTILEKLPKHFPIPMK